jgi:hypothetical protein
MLTFFRKGQLMFLTAYVDLVLLAAFPLVRTLLSGRRAGLPVGWLHLLYRDLGTHSLLVAAQR